jgi:hypothetical protein
MTDYTGTPIQPDQAWRIFDDWKASHREVGIIFYGSSGTSLYTMGVVESARNGKLLLKSAALRPKWPSPPIVEVMSVQAQLANGDWLALAEGLRPDSLPQPALTE